MKSNIDKVTEYMSLGSPLNQLFLIEALTRYAEQITSDKELVREQMEKGFIHPDAWIKCAEDALKAFDFVKS